MGFLPSLGLMGAQAGLSGLAGYFSGKSEEERWKKQMELQLKLEKLRNSLPPEIYARLMKQLTMPLGTHGGGAPSTGNFRTFMSMGRQAGAPRSGRPVPIGSPA